MAESHFDRRRREWKTYVTAWWAAVRGLPAILIVVACVGVLTIAQIRQQQGQVRQRYLAAVHQAAESQEWTVVESLGRKLADLRPADPIGRYYVALAAEAEGDTDRALRLMRDIAPRDRQGYAPAQWWIVQSRTTQRSQPTKADILETRDHLKQFLRAHDRHPQAHALLAQTEIALGNPDNAVRQMEIAGNIEPDLKLAAARLATRLGQTGKGQAQAEQASRHYRRHVQENPDDVEARLNWSETLTMLGETDQAARVLVAGLDLSNDQRLRTGFVKLCCSTFDILQASGGHADKVSPRQLSLLRQSLHFDPQSQPLLKRLAQLTVQQSSVATEAAGLLDPYLANGTAPAVVHLVLGTEALNRNRFEQAREHFGRAHELDPAFPACMNNLAWSLAHGEQPELDRALSLASQATLEAPSRPEFHETHGQILVKLGRFEEAIPELKQGLHATGDVSMTHAMLASAYDALGQTELASYHRKQK